MDHDRTVLPQSSLKNVMKNDRKWFQSLKPVRLNTLYALYFVYVIEYEIYLLNTFDC